MSVSRIINIRKYQRSNALLAAVLCIFVFIGAAYLLISRASTASIAVEAENGTLKDGATLINEGSASGNKAVSFNAATEPGQPTSDGAYITAAQAATLPKSGNGYNNAKAIADAVKTGSLTPNLDNVNTRDGSIALTAATFWLAGGKTDAQLLAGLRAFILKAPGTNKSGTQALNPMRAMGGLLAAVDILDKAGAWNMDANCPNAGMTFRQYLAGLENRNLGTGNSRWQTIHKTATDSANNWGAVALYAMTMVAVVRDDNALLDQSVAVMQRYLGDTSKHVPFNITGTYIRSWDNSSSPSGKVNVGIGLPSTTHPGLDGVVIEDVNRGGTGYSAAAPYYGATGSGLSYPLEAAEYTWATAAVLKNLGYPVNTWSSNALIRMGDWFHRAKDSSGKTNYQHEEAAYAIYKNHRWLGNCFKGGAPYGNPPATSSGTGGLLRAQPYSDWMCGPGSRWPY